MTWSRPSNIPVGQIWSKFEGKGINGERGQKFQIRDVEPSDRKRCLDMMESVFLKDEPLSQVLGIQSDFDSMATIRSNWERYADQGICVACYTEVDGEPRDLVGCNILIVRCADDEDEDIDNVVGETWKKLLRTLVSAERLVDAFEHYGVSKYLSSSGLAVLATYRGQNIGARIIAAREAVCAAFGLDTVCTVFTARSSQVLAAKCGYEQLAELPYEDMLQYGIDLSCCSTSSAILMGRQYKLPKGSGDR